MKHGPKPLIRQNILRGQRLLPRIQAKDQAWKMRLSLECVRSELTRPAKLALFCSDTKQNQQTKKNAWDEAWRQPGVSFPHGSSPSGVLSQWSLHIGAAKCPAISCDNICKMLSNREAHQRLNAQGFYWGLVI